MLDQCVLHDGHSSFKTLAEFTGSSNRKPHGSVILSRGENLTAVGILHCRDGSSRISPVSLSDEILSGLRPSNISGEMSREQSTVQQQSDSISPEPAREIPAEQPNQVGERARHEVLPANREGDLTTSNIQAQRNEKNMSQVNPDEGPSNISGEMLREQSTVQRQSDSISPEPAREIPAEQPTQVGERARHEVLPANREGDLTTSSIQAQRNERNLSQVNPADEGPSNISGEMLREQSTVQRQSDSISPEPAREIPAEQPTQVGERARHEVLPANRESDLTTSNTQAQRNERNLSQVNPADEVCNRAQNTGLGCQLDRVDSPIENVTKEMGLLSTGPREVKFFGDLNDSEAIVIVSKLGQDAEKLLKTELGRVLNVSNISTKELILQSKSYPIRRYTDLLADSHRGQAIKTLRKALPTSKGVVGPLMPLNKFIRDVSYTLRRNLTMALSADDHWKVLAERLGMEHTKIKYLDSRKDNPADGVLRHWEVKAHSTVGVLYDILVEIECPVIADLL